ncbi:hypothetical protein QQF64_004998 [Cirrhinus molitorella]|uniref:Uncharacterized protein n=1 Tax=Cirrhinus molitorella TaxID=172907 RepID=A0ABR3MHV7_9TELE
MPFAGLVCFESNQSLRINYPRVPHFGANEVRLGEALKPPLLISFHHPALGRLETARPVIAFFRQPSADWTAANQSLVYIL